MSTVFCLTIPVESVTTAYLKQQYGYLNDAIDLPTPQYGYPYKNGIYVASRGKVSDTGFDLFSLVYMPTKQIADKTNFTIKAVRLLQRHIQFDMPISFASYLKILKHYGYERLELFNDLPAISLIAKL